MAQCLRSRLDTLPLSFRFLRPDYREENTGLRCLFGEFLVDTPWIFLRFDRHTRLFNGAGCGDR